jgi:hypothetical protein
MDTPKGVVERQKALEEITLTLGRLQGLAKSADESFLAFILASAQRQAALRCRELDMAGELAPAFG